MVQGREGTDTPVISVCQVLSESYLSFQSDEDDSMVITVILLSGKWIHLPRITP